MRALCLDMTLCNTGYVVFEYDSDWRPMAAGLVSPERPDTREYEMMKDLRRAEEMLDKLFQVALRTNARIMVVELLAGSQTASTAETFGIAKGVLAALKWRLELPVLLVNARAVKRAVTGHKDASKADMIVAADKKYPHLFGDLCGMKKTKKRDGTVSWPNDAEHVADAAHLMAEARNSEMLRLLVQSSPNNVIRGVQ